MFTKNNASFLEYSAYQSNADGGRAYRHFPSCKPGKWAVKYFADGYQHDAVIDDFGNLTDVGYTNEQLENQRLKKEKDDQLLRSEIAQGKWPSLQILQNIINSRT